MVQTASTMMPLGTKAPTFQLPDVISGKNLSFKDLKGTSATLIMFICNHCPYVIHIRQELVKLAQDYHHRGVSLVAINSNDVVAYPDDSPEKMKQIAKEFSFPFPYLFDETQEVAKRYQAACTPDFFLFDGKDTCVYRGQWDDSRPKNDVPPSGKDIREALEQLLQGKPISPDQKPSIGCNIKWKKKD